MHGLPSRHDPVSPVRASAGGRSALDDAGNPVVRRQGEGRHLPPVAERIPRPPRMLRNFAQLGKAQSLLHRKPGAGRSALPLSAGPLPQEIPRPIRRPVQDLPNRPGRPARRQLGADLPSPRRDVRQRQRRSTQPQSVDQYDAVTGAALRLRSARYVLALAVSPAS